MSQTRDGVFTEHRILAEAKGLGKDTCHKCHKPFKMLDAFHIRRNNNGTYWYHQACWKSLFY